MSRSHCSRLIVALSLLIVVITIGVLPATAQRLSRAERDSLLAAGDTAHVSTFVAATEDFDGDGVADTLMMRTETVLANGARRYALPHAIYWGVDEADTAAIADTTLFDLAFTGGYSAQTYLYDEDGDGLRDLVVVASRHVRETPETPANNRSKRKKLERNRWAIGTGTPLRSHATLTFRGTAPSGDDLTWMHEATHVDTTHVQYTTGGYAIRRMAPGGSFERGVPPRVEAERSIAETEDVTALRLIVKPNPVADVLVTQLLAPGDVPEPTKLTLQVVDAQGKIVLVQPLRGASRDEQQLRVSTLVPGWYVLRYVSAERVLVDVRFVISR